MTIKKNEIKAKGAKKPYEGMPAYKAGHKDAIEELRDYIKKNIIWENPTLSLKMVCDKIAEMCRSV